MAGSPAGGAVKAQKGRTGGFSHFQNLGRRPAPAACENCKQQLHLISKKEASARGPEGPWGSGAGQRCRGSRQAGTCSPGPLPAASLPGSRQFPPLTAALPDRVSWNRAQDRTRKHLFPTRKEVYGGGGRAPTRLPMASHGTCSPEPCKSAPRKPWRSFFKKDRFLCLSLQPSMPKPQGPFLKVFFPLWDFPLLPDPLSAPTLWCLQEPPPPLSPYSCNCVWLPDPFRFLRPLWTYRWGVGLWDSRTKEPERPCPGPDTPSAASFGPEKRGSAARGRPPPAPVSGTFRRGATGGCVGGGGGPCNRPTGRPPRNWPAWPWSPMASTYWAPLFHQQFKKTCQKQLCLTAMCSFFLPFFS